MSADEELLTFQRFMLAFDTPACLRRARQVEAEWEHTVALCARERERRLELPKLRLAQLIVATRGIEHPERIPVETAIRDAWLELYQDWKPRLRTRVPQADNSAVRELVDQVCQSFSRFNISWDRWLGEVDLQPANRLREEYNRYYLLEKECAIRSEQSAKDGFEPLSPALVADLPQLFPKLPVPDVEQGLP